MDAASLRQIQAAEPRSSTWLSANAGSGKTRVLTDRVARLLLDGAEPQSILCLTYTKAAASEMQNRLFKRLGDWAMKPDAALAADLEALGVGAGIAPERLGEARRLFARAIETPGGLRIQTIHSFCASLLRRFPLEAGVSPNFTEIDDRAGALLQEQVLETLAEQQPALLDGLGAHFSGDDLGPLIRAVLTQRTRFEVEETLNGLSQRLGLPGGYDAAAALRACFDGSEPRFMPHVLDALAASDKVTDQKAAATLRPVDWAAPSPADIRLLASVFLFGESAKAPFAAKLSSFPTKATQAKIADALPDLHALMERVQDMREPLNGLEAAQKTLALHQFGHAFLGDYSAEKQRRGWLDFDDLILKTGALLSDEAVASWVLFRLDGGLDHILIDEAQDTSPAQWRVITQLAQEFTSGIGARGDTLRTIFVVGDKKQSIYSFQGADPREFDRMSAYFEERLRSIEAPFTPLELEYSFRSSDAILRFVDNTVAIDPMLHRAFHTKHPGRVDLWPVVPKTEDPEKHDWFDPVDVVSDDHHDVILARNVAAFIKRQIGREMLPTNEGTRRLIRASDFLILVRRRSTLFEEIIRACKKAGLPVAGADRLKLGAELAVKDLGALLSFVATPEDDLSLAAVLKSPLFGWTEAQLYDLAAGRQSPYLWVELRRRRDEFAEAHAVLTDLLNVADFKRPYDLIERILTIHDGRRNLLARLGAEAEDGIDALLAQSLAYEQTEVPSLTGFLTWMQTDDVEIKRQLDDAGDQIRVMTVHGAKGLESPIVILPDTAKRRPPTGDQVVAIDDTAFWREPKERRPARMVEAIEAKAAAQLDEQERLFYVAATRAETWLVIAGAGGVGEAGESWYVKAEAGLQEMGAAPHEGGLRYEPIPFDGGKIVSDIEPDAAEVVIPRWAAEPAPPVTRPPLPRAPSSLGGAKALPGPMGQSEEEALRHGSMVHRLLELSDIWRDDDAAAARILAAEFAGIDPASATAQARGILQAPDLAFLFAPEVLSEVDISAALPELGGARISGAIDKLVIRDGSILAVDFKTNATVPGAPAQVPEGLLRQMGAYQSALAQVYPDTRVEVAILWTETAALMPLPHDIVRQALERAATS